MSYTLVTKGDFVFSSMATMPDGHLEDAIDRRFS